MSLGVQPVKDDSKLQIRQSPTEHLPRTPMRALFLANSGGGKTTLIANLLTRKELYGKAFSTFYIFSPSVHHDGTWQSVKKYMREQMGQKPEEHFFSKWDPQQIQEIVDTQFQITKFHKTNGHKRGHSICIVIDDWADRADVLHQGDGWCLEQPFHQGPPRQYQHVDRFPAPYAPFHNSQDAGYVAFRFPPTQHERPRDVLGRVFGDRAEEDAREDLHRSDT